MTTRATRPPMARRPWHVRVNALVIAWFLAAAVVVIAHRWIPEYRYLLVHLMMLGGVTTAILIWSTHFAETLLGRPAPGGQRVVLARLGLHTASAIAVIVGVLTARHWLVVAGAVGIGVVAVSQIVALLIQRRGALMARFGGLALYYVAAALNLAIGVWFGTLLAAGGGDAEWQARLYTGHTTTMLLGWVGLTVLGTLVVLWPTMLRTQLAPGATAAARRALVVLLAGLAIVWTAVGTGRVWLVPLAAIAYLIGVGMLVTPMAQVARRKPPASFGTYSAIGALAWLAICLGWLAVIGASATSWGEAQARLGALAEPFVVGFAAQILLGAMSYLAPVMLGGGPRMVKRVDREMNRAAGARVVIVNVGGGLYLLPAPSLVKVTLSLLVFLALGAFLVLLGRALWARFRPREQADDPVVTTTIATGPPPPPRRLGPLAGLGAVALAVVLGVAGDPAAAGLGTAPADESIATGETIRVVVEARDMRFHPDVIEVPTGNRLVIELRNADPDVHDLVLETGAASGRIGSEESVEFDAGIIATDLDGWCSVAGHRQLGMTLTVRALGEDAGGDADDIAASGDAGQHGAATGGEAGDRGVAEEGHGAHGASAGPSARADLDLGRDPGADFAPHPAELEPAPGGDVHEVTLTVSEMSAEVAPGIRQQLWLYNGTAPGPTLRGAVGDVFDITLVNDGTIGHSIDFHAGSLAPDEPMRTIGPGESLTYRFTAERSGIWLYHCATVPMSLHIAQGMFGAVIIDPPDLPEVDREYLLVQSEYYLGPQGEVGDPAAIGADAPDLVVFNGYAHQYDHAPLAARAGERVRFWVLPAGPSRGTAFHVVGGQFDTMYVEGA
ncbi:MAG TPA: multicopper oxidase domain-containing protein, partial [Actinomycetaceae bacterium]|nr:multicopper oxidase domain-containing protein [Actinomycetaceae bacterium]